MLAAAVTITITTVFPWPSTFAPRGFNSACGWARMSRQRRAAPQAGPGGALRAGQRSLGRGTGAHWPTRCFPRAHGFEVLCLMHLPPRSQPRGENQMVPKGTSGSSRQVLAGSRASRGSTDRCSGDNVGRSGSVSLAGLGHAGRGRGDHGSQFQDGGQVA